MSSFSLLNTTFSLFIYLNIHTIDNEHLSESNVTAWKRRDNPSEMHYESHTDANEKLPSPKTCHVQNMLQVLD